MSNQNAHFKDELNDLADAARKQIGAPPSPEELIAYQDGALPEPARESVQNKLALMPESAQAFLDLVALARMESPENDDESRAVDALVPEWAQIKAHLETEDHHSDIDSDIDRARRSRSKSSAAPHWHTWGLVAAVSLVAILVIVVWEQRSEIAQLSRPHVNVHQVHLAPLAKEHLRTDATTPVTVVPHGGSHVLLVLNLGDHGMYTDYRLELFEHGDPEGQPQWTSHGLVPSAYGTFNIEISRASLGASEYRLRLFGLVDQNEDLLAEYRVRIKFE